jgi:hypothetical protein
MAEIIELRHAEATSNEQLFSAIFEMKVDLRAIDEFADALALISETMDESPAPTPSIGWYGKSSSERRGWRHAAATCWASHTPAGQNLLKNSNATQFNLMTAPGLTSDLMGSFQGPQPVAHGTAAIAIYSKAKVLPLFRHGDATA